MVNFNPVRGTQEFINNTPIVDGQFLFVTDQDTGKNHIYVDVGTNRIAVGAFNWTSILNKPFTTIGSNLTVNENGVLSADIQTWSQITNKPFVTIGIGLEVDENENLNANIGWNDVLEKPFDAIGSNLTVNSSGVLSADAQTWGQITNKPFIAVGSNLTVDGNGVLSANIQTWNQITTKPFSTIGTGLTVINGELCATGGGTGVDWSTEVINKPFETLGSSFVVNNGVLNLNNINWNIITSKPFNTIGSGLTVDNNNVLKTNISWNDVLSKPFVSIGSGLIVDNNNVLKTNISWNDVLSKPFVSIGSGLTVDNNILIANIQTVTAPTVGTASSNTVRQQNFTIDGVNLTTIPINGTSYMEYSQNIIASQITTYTFNNSLITPNSIIDVYTSEWGIIPSSIEITAGQCNVIFVEAVDINNMTCRIYIK